MNYIVSAHGGRFDNTANTRVPDGITIKFFVNDLVELSNDEHDNPNSWDIYEDLRDGSDVKVAAVDAQVVQTVNPGDNVYNYYCWKMEEDDDVAAASGVFAVGGNRVIELPDEAHAIQLSALFGQLQTPTTIYWAACRTSEPAPAAAPAAAAAI